jgi:hypothetical protein
VRPAGRFGLAALEVVALSLIGSRAHAVDPFEIQVYDGAVNDPRTAGIELHVNSVVSGRRDAVPPEIPADHQTHFTFEPSLGITNSWELGGYLQTALRADGRFDYAGIKLRSKFVLPPSAGSRFRFGVNLEVSRLPEAYDRGRWGMEVRPIVTSPAGGGRLYFAVNPIVDFALAGPDADQAPSFEPGATALYVFSGVASIGLEYYANLGPLGSWLPGHEQEHYLFEVFNVLKWKHWEVNGGIGEGLTAGSNPFVVKVILGFK